MTELPESPGAGPHRTGGEGRDGGPEGRDDGPDAQDRPKLVAVPGPVSEAEVAPVDESVPGDAAASDPAAPDSAAPDTAAAEPAVPAAGADAARLRLERSLSGPYASGPLNAAAADAVPAPAMRDPGSMPMAPRVAPDELMDAIATAGTPALVAALRSELAMRANAEAGLRTRVVDAETRLAARVLFARRTAETLQELRTEFDRLAELLTDERARRQAADRRVAELERELAVHRGRSDDTEREIAVLRDSLAQLRDPVEASAPGDEEPSGDAGAVRPERLSDALTRLRAGTQPMDQAPAPPGAEVSAALTPATPGVASAGPPPVTDGAASAAPRATLAGPFRTLCRRDPALAGQLALSLLPLQRIAYSQPISYDIVLDPGQRCIQVTSSDGGVEVARQTTARPPQQVDLQLFGDEERFAKLLAAGRWRRRLGFGVSRVRGDRAGLAALDALLALPLDLPLLVEGGMSKDPWILAHLRTWSKRAQSE